MENNELNEEIIRLAYRLILGREPEDQKAIENHIALSSVENLRNTLINSREFKNKSFINYDNDYFKKLHSELARQPIETKNELLILQTCDRENYVPMLQHTSLTVLEYVKRHGVNYEIFIGLKKGVWPWHAIFNRIYKLNEYIESGYKDWVLYMDADAYICDMDFDLLSYLSDKKKYAFVLAQAETKSDYWNINDGIFFANLGHPVCVNVIQRWKKFYDYMYKDDDYVIAVEWDMIINDQTSFHDIIKYDLYKSYLCVDGTSDVFNSGHAKVIRQVIRENRLDNCVGTLVQRTEIIAAEVRKALASLSAK